MRDPRRLVLCLGGDLMTGRGVDQLFPTACDPRLMERWVTDARDYVEIAERANGPVPRPVGHEYPWGDALAALDRLGPDAFVANLETSVTTSATADLKGINYRMHPANVPVLAAGRVDCVTLANNHVLDWGRDGLVETLDVLAGAGVRAAGAGADREQAESPAIVPVAPRARVLVFAFATMDSGVPWSWRANDAHAGIHLLPDLSPHSARHVAALVDAWRLPGDVVVASVHWGPNWGWQVPPEQRRFAHALVDDARVDVVFGHSSHHPKAIEVHGGRPILYGCGELLDDYEGIQGHAEHRPDLVLLYALTLDASTGALERLAMTPFRISRMRLTSATPDERAWLRATLDRECARFDGRVVDDGEDLVLT